MGVLGQKEALFIHVASRFDDTSSLLSHEDTSKMPDLPRDTEQYMQQSLLWGSLTCCSNTTCSENATLENQLNRKSHAKQLWFKVFDLCLIWLPVPSGTLPLTRIQTEACGSNMKFFLLQHSGTINGNWLTGWFWWVGAQGVLETMKRVIFLSLTDGDEYKETT